MTREQYGEAYEKHFEPMVRAFIGRGLRHDRAEDLVQSAFVRGFERLDQLKDDKSVIGWISTIALNKVRDDARSRSRLRQLEPQDTIAVPPAVNLAAIDAERILNLCDERQRRMCTRVYLQESSVVAEEMGISGQALSSALARIRQMIRKKLAA